LQVFITSLILIEFNRKLTGSSLMLSIQRHQPYHTKKGTTSYGLGYHDKKYKVQNQGGHSIAPKTTSANAASASP